MLRGSIKVGVPKVGKPGVGRPGDGSGNSGTGTLPVVTTTSTYFYVAGQY